jgi:hypothetical protein
MIRILYTSSSLENRMWTLDFIGVSTLIIQKTTQLYYCNPTLEDKAQDSL